MILLRASALKLHVFFVIYDSQFPLASSIFGRDSIQYRVGKTHCQGHQDPSKSVSIFLRETEANVKMVFIYAVFISRSRTVLLFRRTKFSERGFCCLFSFAQGGIAWLVQSSRPFCRHLQEWRALSHVSVRPRADAPACHCLCTAFNDHAVTGEYPGPHSRGEGKPF